MEFKALLNDNDAVSPVIGVILMVAITVILAAVIGTFVLGLGDQVQETAPNTNIAFDYDGDETLEITQTGGQGINKMNLGVSVGGDMYYDGNSNQYSGGTAVGTSGSDHPDETWFTTNDKTSAGDSVTIQGDTTVSDNDGVIETGTSDGISSVDEVRVVWRSGDSSSTVQTWENN